jgi:hypothetical protein
MNNELVRIWKEAGRGLIEVYMPGEAEENYKIFERSASSYGSPLGDETQEIC